jgi:hypothetical protein
MPSPNTMTQPRDKGGATDSRAPGEGTKRNKGASLIREANGPVNPRNLFTRWPAGAAVSPGEGARNTVPVPSAIGDRDFWARRAEGPRI